MLRFLGVCHHVLYSLRRFRAQLDQAHGESCSFAGDCIVLIQVRLEMIVHVSAMRTHGCQTETKAAAVTDLFIATLFHLVQQVLGYLASMVGMDKTKGVKSTTLSIARAKKKSI